MISFTPWIVAGVATAGLSIFLWTSQTKIETLTKEVTQAHQTIETQKQTIEVLEQEYTRQTSRLSELQRNLTKAEQEKEKVLQLFRKHNLEKILTQKPGLVEKKLNESTKKVFRQLERDTAQ